MSSMPIAINASFTRLGSRKVSMSRTLKTNRKTVVSRVKPRKKRKPPRAMAKRCFNVNFGITFAPNPMFMVRTDKPYHTCLG